MRRTTAAYNKTSLSKTRTVPRSSEEYGQEQRKNKNNNNFFF